jgi:hypothetical protein
MPPTPENAGPADLAPTHGGGRPTSFLCAPATYQPIEDSVVAMAGSVRRLAWLVDRQQWLQLRPQRVAHSSDRRPSAPYPAVPAIVSDERQHPTLRDRLAATLAGGRSRSHQRRGGCWQDRADRVVVRWNLAGGASRRRSALPQSPTAPRRPSSTGSIWQRDGRLPRSALARRLPRRTVGARSRVLRLVAQGLPNIQVGERRFLSPRTIGARLRAISSKLGAR